MKKSIPNNQLATTSTPILSSQKLIQCLIKLESVEKSDAKMELISMVSDLMPQGNPKYLEIIKYPMIKQLIETEGKKRMLAVVVLMVKDFCSSLNVVRNMNEDQMIETAAMLLDECDNFRLEDYMIMFSLAKRGQLVKIMDRIDLQVITNMLDEYFIRRKKVAMNQMQEEATRLDSIGNTTRQIEKLHPEDAKLISATDGISAAIEALRSNFTNQALSDEEAKKDIHTPKIKYSYGAREDGSEGFIKNESK